MRVGWIGMGQIGCPMALRVLAAGHALVGHARSPDRFDAVRVGGGAVTASLHGAVAGADVVCVNLFSEAQLDAVAFGAGVLDAIMPGATLVIHSTVSPAAMRRLVAAREDVSVLDAAFSGTAQDAADGRIALMVGANAAVLERVRPVLASYSDHIALVGPPGAGMALKLVNNLLFAAQAGLARDALRMAAAAGITTADAVRTLSRSSGGSHALDLFGAALDPDAVLQSLRPYLEKDVATAIDAAGGADLGALADAVRRWTGSQSANDSIPAPSRE